MKNNEKCLKCGSTLCEIKTTVLPKKKMGDTKISLDKFYLKICQNCGYSEMYSAKVIEKSKKAAKTTV